MSSEPTDGVDPRSVPYPGGKTALAPWVCRHLPAHECYVEPFAGSAAVLVEKDRSTVEVLNDADGMLIRAYRTIRDDLGELVDRLQSVPYARTLHEDWKRHLDTGEWPADDVEATARWLFLRYSQHSAKLTASSGFKTSKVTNPGKAWANARDALPALADRLDGVILETGDWMDVANQYDGPDTVQYFDPPYCEGKGDELYRHAGTFDHGRLADWLVSAESNWLVSYEALPRELEAKVIASHRDDDRDTLYVLTEETEYRGSARDGDECKTATERLVCNFDPEQTPAFSAANQTTLTNATK